MQPAATDAGELYEPLLEHLRNLQAVVRNGPNLRDHEEEGIRTLRTAIRTLDVEGSAAFRYLATTSMDFTVALLDDLLFLAGSDNYTLTVCELLGRLPHDQAQEVVPPAVAKRLESQDVDYMDWQRLADVLHYLGLYDALRELIARARDHIDGDVRGVVDAYPDF